MLGLRNLQGVHRLLDFKRGDTLDKLYKDAANAYDMPGWATLLILCGSVVPASGVIDEDWTQQFLNATVTHVVYKRRIVVQLPDTSLLDVPFPPPHYQKSIACTTEDLFDAVSRQISKSHNEFFLEINGTTTAYEEEEDARQALPNNLNLGVAVTFASPLRWSWVRLSIAPWNCV